MALTLQVLLFVGCLSSFTQCQTSLSSSDKEELLLAHNYFRSIVSPTAANMQRMVSWNINHDDDTQPTVKEAIAAH